MRKRVRVLPLLMFTLKITAGVNPAGSINHSTNHSSNQDIVALVLDTASALAGEESGAETSKTIRKRKRGNSNGEEEGAAAAPAPAGEVAAAAPAGEVGAAAAPAPAGEVAAAAPAGEVGAAAVGEVAAAAPAGEVGAACEGDSEGDSAACEGDSEGESCFTGSNFFQMSEFKRMITEENWSTSLPEWLIALIMKVEPVAP